MTEKGVVDLTCAESDFDLLDIIRYRHQMFAVDIRALSGILTGYGLAKENFERKISGFSKYLTDLKKVNPLAVSWWMIISAEAEREEYEIPIFFGYLDAYRNLKHEVLGKVELTQDQRTHDFERRMAIVNVDYPELPIKPPHKLSVMNIEDIGVALFYYDEKGTKYYEQCVRDYDSAKSLALQCFEIKLEQW